MVTREPEPFYQGHSLSGWLDDYYIDSRESLEDDQPQTEAYFAIRAIGTNALPTLLRWVEHEPNPWQERLRWFALKLPPPVADFGFVRRLAQSGQRPNNWPQAFGVLGSLANGAVPELTRIMRREPAADDLGALPALALAYIGPAGLAPLMAAAADPRASCQNNAIYAVAGMGTNAIPAIPLLIQCLTNANLDATRAATAVLGELHLQPDIVLPALANCLQSPDPKTRILAAAWLAEVEAYRPTACHVLLTASKHPSEEVRTFANHMIDMLPGETKVLSAPDGEMDWK
jgi:hypothetical protein